MRFTTMLLLKPLFLAASAAALVIPEVSEADEDIFRTLPIDDTTAAIPLFTSIQVPCQQCDGRNTEIQMDFDVQDETRLMLNNFELYPGADPSSPDLSARVVEGDGRGDRKNLGYVLAIWPGDVDEDQHFEILYMELQVTKAGTRFVEGVPPVKVKIIKAPTGEIMIAGLKLGKTDESSKTDKSSDDKQCTTMVCRFEKLFGDAWNGVKGSRKGCGGMQAHGNTSGDRKHPHGQSEHKNGGHKNGGHHKGDHKNGGHHKGGHHHHSGDNDKETVHHSWGKMMRTVMSYVVLPILMGITTGITVAILTMSLGTLIVRFVRFVRGDRSQASVGGCHKAAVAEATVDEEEKADLITNQGPPPQYEDERPHN